MNAPLSVVTAGPFPVSQAIWIVSGWIVAALIAGALVQYVTVTLAPAADKEERTRAMQLWIGHSGILGTTLSVATGLALVLVAVFSSFYLTLIARDVSTAVLYAQNYGDRFLSAIRRYKFLTEFTDLLRMPQP